MNSAEICSRIKAIREIRSISQVQIAKHLGVSQSTYAKIENGISKLSLDRFIQIVEFLDTDPAFYFREITNPRQKPNRPYKKGASRSSNWEESHSFNLYVVAKQPEEPLKPLKDIMPKSA